MGDGNIERAEFTVVWFPDILWLNTLILQEFQREHKEIKLKIIIRLL